MGSISKNLENIFTAITFAEVGEFETAREIMTEEQQKRKTIVHQKKSHGNHGVLHAIPVTES